MKKIAFTIVLNGMPYIETQSKIIPEVFDEWYIVEGAVKPILDTSWCKQIDSKFFNEKKLSIDGTTEFLDSIKSEKIKVIRKNDFWDGKLEMCNSFMSELENCILMEFDVDEIWDISTLKNVLNYSQENDQFDGMLFKCDYFVGKDLVLEGENCYGNMPYEWSRLWKIKNKTNWISHEPPRIKGLNRFLTKQFTSSKGWKFKHYAYALEEQLRFKENFYGYNNAVEGWRRLQNENNFPALLKNYFPWVNDNAIVKRITSTDNIIKNISVIVQGPLDERTNEVLDAYKNFGEIIISTWQGENDSKLNNVTVIKNKIQNYKYYNEGRIYDMAYTFLMGMKLAKFPYALKTRSDELYPNLEKFIENFNNNKEKIHTTDNGFWKHHPFSFSNHLFLGSKDFLIKGCEHILKLCTEQKEKLNELKYSSEQMFGKYLFEGNNIPLDKNNWKEIYRKNVFITPCRDLPNHLHSGQSFSQYKVKRVRDYPNGRRDGHNASALYQNINQL